MSFYTNFVGVSSAALYLTTQGKEFTAMAAPFVGRYATLASSKLAQFANYIGVGATYTNYAPIVADKIVKWTPDFKALTNLSPVHGLVAGQGLTLLAGIIEEGLIRAGMDSKKWTIIRIPLSHAVAGAAVFGLSMLALKVGLVAGALTIGGAITLTATSMAINIVVRSVFAVLSCCCCCSPSDNVNEEEQEEEVNKQNQNQQNQELEAKTV